MPGTHKSFMALADAAVARQLHRSVTSSGGFTIDLRSGEPLAEGLSVCVHPSVGLRFPLEEWDDEEVLAWLATQDGRLCSEDLHLGGWLDRATDQVWLDVVRVFPECLRDLAVVFAVRHRQRAVFDLRVGEVIALTERLGASA